MVFRQSGGFQAVLGGFQVVLDGLEGRRALLPPLAALTQRGPGSGIQ